MGNSLRCCLACVLPCGALDVIRIVHLNGHVEELRPPVSAGEILRAHPNHLLSKPTSQGMVHRILILSPDSDLKRGHIYFLLPASSIPEKKRPAASPAKKRPAANSHHDRHLSEKKKPWARGDRRGAWRPRLESIGEDS